MLDFGLAKAPLADGIRDATTTGKGVILGTPAYMAPEQAAGSPVDRRADIWAFGVVLYEMLTGERLFEAQTTSQTLAAVHSAPIDLTKLPKATAPAIRHLLARCLDRNVQNRLRDIGEARVAIGQTVQDEDQAEGSPSLSHARWPWMATAVVMFLVISVLLIHNWWSSAHSNTSLAVRMTMELAPAENLPGGSFRRPSQTVMAFSPDGNTLVFSGSRGSGADATTQLYRRALDQSEALPFPGTEGAVGPFFSPDGNWVGFWGDGKLKKIPMSGGPAVTICDVSTQPWGAAWGSVGMIVFADASSSGALIQVSATTAATPQPLIRPDPNKGEIFTSPEFLPDGRTLLFTARNTDNWDEARVVARLPDNGELRLLLKGGADAHYVSTGHLIYILNAKLMAVPFDPNRLECTGTAVPLLDGVMQAVNMPSSIVESGIGQFAVSRSGNLVYASGGIYPAHYTTLARVDRKGTVTDLTLPKGRDFGVRLSPDGQRLAVHRYSPASRMSDIWTYDLVRGTATRLTTQGNCFWPLWSLDGKRILYQGGPGRRQILSMLADGQGAIETVATGKATLTPASWSPDGKWLAYLDGERQIWVRSTSGLGGARLFWESKSDLRAPEFSPDGKWMAYSSDDPPFQVYVQAFPGPGERHRISTDNGINAVWARNGRELFYFGGPRPLKMMAVEISAGGPFKAGAPRTLFEGSWFTSNPLRSYDVDAEGQHFIMIRGYGPHDQRVTQLNVVLNWFEELKRRAPRQ